MYQKRRIASILILLALACPVAAQPRPNAAPPRAAEQRATAPAEVSRDLDKLPAGVRRMRMRIIEAARSGDIGKLTTAIESNELPPSFVRGQRLDPIAYLRERSADGAGREVLALLLNMLEQPFGRIEAGKPQEMFVWPYVATLDPKAWTPEQIVDAYRVLPARDVKETLARGRYVGPRLGIGPDGTWHYFLTGE
jgi:hypothetical protein